MRRPLLLATCALSLVAPGASAQVAGAPVTPILNNPLAVDVEAFTGGPVAADPRRRLRVPRHPFMARNGASNIHNDAYQSDTYNRAGPLGDDTVASSSMFARECASVTFDSRGRIVSICVGLDHPVLAVLDPVTLGVLGTYDLPIRQNAGANPFTSFAGGGYFYLDHRDRAVVPTADREIVTISVDDGGGLTETRRIDLRADVAQGDAIIALMPDWGGRIWFATVKGTVGFVSRNGRRVESLETGEPIGNSFAVDESGGVFIVTDAAMYRFEARRRKVRAAWKRSYPNVGFVKSGQTQAGSGTTPTLIGRASSRGGGLVAITDNADPMAIRVYRRGRRAAGRRLVCRKPVLEQGASATDQSLIGAHRSIVVENNFGYNGVAATLNGATTTPGLERVDLDRDGRGCKRRWRSQEIAPSAVPKLSLGAGLVYTYTKPPRDDSADAWYLTAIDFDNGKTRWRRLAGTGFGFNNNFSPVSIGPGGTAYVGVLGGITRFEDG